MRLPIRSSKARRAGIAVAALVLLATAVAAFAGGPASAVSEVVSGKFDTKLVIGGDCDAPAGICATGATTGNLKGTFALRVAEVIPTDDTPSTGVLLFTGDGTVETKDGTLRCKNAGALETRDDGILTSLCVVTGDGTGDWVGASGYFQVDGTVDLAAASATGSYKGQITRP
jgi:hypothetical protein